MPGRQYSSNPYRYGYNGKENDKEAVGTGQGTQDYGMRIYSPSLGRFLSVDPLSDSYPWNSTYAFAENDVIRCIDLDGTEKTEPAYLKQNGGYTTAIDNTGRGSMTQAAINRQLMQAMNQKKGLYIPQGPPPSQGEIRQGGIYGDPDYIATTTNMDNILTYSGPFYDISKRMYKGEKVEKGEVVVEAVLNLPIFKMASPALRPILRYVSKEGKLLLKGAGEFGMCKEFASDFMKKIAPSLRSEGAQVVQKELKAYSDYGIYQNNNAVTSNGYHTLIEVIQDGKTFIVDNLNPNGKTLKEDFIKTLEVTDPTDGKLLTGEDAYKLFTEK